ncbi:DUF4085 family protein [Jeotgalibacillus sp. R-1-5s-1]|uniref:DUF4085 family protein n=1 Tax=Jeotgalibacillus sp. R-1-5s-1 TaxID=2555897 RepID=UPI00106C9648|nr:DUF4085 family protein [Jeotgalibacillus sp. R-1-5s-1]TFD94392.1 DUF4085 family protein [Jeotgalibacillus sp. R-1-5s-1]
MKITEMTWNIDKEMKELFRKQVILPIPESDDEWSIMLDEAAEEEIDLSGQMTEDLNEAKEELSSVLPDRFLPYLENGTLNQPDLPTDVREDYLQWIRESEIAFESKLNAAFENKEKAAVHLSSEAQNVFTDSLHDGVIQLVERNGNSLRLHVNNENGFSTKAMVILDFKGITSEESDEPIQTGQWFIYDELQKTDDGFALRVLFDCPESQWTIHMKELEAEALFRPKQYVTLKDEDKLDGLPVTEYLTLLNPEHSYRFISPTEDISISLNDEWALDDPHAIDYIYTNVFEDPYAHFNEPMPSDQILDAALSENIQLQVQAWNTLYHNPQEHRQIINQLLRGIELTGENEMVIGLYVQHFYDAAVLDEENIRKFDVLIERS